jgi:hypothetical protein
MTGPKFPNVRVKLSGRDGNAFAILGNVTGAMRRADVPKEDIDAFTNEAMSGDYDHLLQTCFAYVEVK